ncbi:MAG: YjfB family protein [Ruminiclostridium sp.]
MDISALSTAMSQVSLGEKVGISVAKLAMDTASHDSEDLTKMMELSVNPNVGQNFDESI